MSFWYYMLLIAVGLLIPTAYAGWIGAPYAPTRLPVVRKALGILDIKEDHLLIDLGVGDGSILLEAAKKGAHAYGYELSPIMYGIAWIRAHTGKHKAKVLYGNFYKKPIEKLIKKHHKGHLEEAHIFAFLMPENMKKVSDFLALQTIPKAKYLLAYAFPFKDIEPLTIIRENKCAPIYVYDLSKLTRPMLQDDAIDQKG